MKGVSREIGEMKIPLRLDARPIRHIPYRMNPVYRQKVKAEIDKMLEAGVIEPVEVFEWIIPMVVQEKKQGGIRILLMGKFDLPSTGRIDLVRGCLNNPSHLV
jgi:hypothetical protein